MSRFGGVVQMLSLAGMLCVLSSCYNDPSLSRAENSDIQRMRYAGWGEEEKGIVYRLLRTNSERLAEEAAKKGDYRLIGFRGYKSKGLVQPAGVLCSAPVEILEQFQGCIPGPPIYYKLIYRYNIALIRQPSFPQKNSCKIDQAAVDQIEKMETEWDEGLKKDAADQIKKWEEKNKKAKLYND